MVGSVATATVRAVKGRKILASRAALVLTQSAVERVKCLLNDKPDAIGLRVGVRMRGCNGMSYTLDYTTEKKKFDEVVVQDGATVIVDAKAQMSLLGTEMDFVQAPLASEFVFNNPNIKGTCGCGESFSV